MKKARVSNRSCIWLALHYPFQALWIESSSVVRRVILSHRVDESERYSWQSICPRLCRYGPDAHVLLITLRIYIFFITFFLLFYNYFLRYEDVDECTSQTHDCPANGVCTNVEGSFQCECRSGFTGDGKTCDGRSRDKIVAYLLSLCLFLNLNLNMVSSATSAMDITQTLKH